MTAITEAAKRLLGRAEPTLGERLAALEAATGTASGRLDEVLTSRATAVVQRASARLSISGSHTVVALAGATGSGKSSTFNALAGSALTEVGVRRPTTSVTTGCAWGSEDPGELFGWLGVQRRHHLPDAGQWDGLILLDLPDHDSTEVSHHLEVDRLVELVDLMVWVVDPQKYADAALHERYLRRLATHREVIIVVLNHIDAVAGSARAEMVADLGRLLADDGLGGVPLLATSAKTGEGLGDLRALVEARVRAKRAAADRLAADLTASARELLDACGDVEPSLVSAEVERELVDSLAEAAGVPTVVQAVQRSVARRGSQHTGWLITAWVSKLKPDPLKRLHLDLGAGGKELVGLGRASTPEPTRVQRARVDTAVREVADRLGAGLTPPWSEAVRRASLIRLPDLNDSLDRAVVGTDLGAAKTPLWWKFARFGQVLLALATLSGALWLGLIAVLGYLQLPDLAAPEWSGLPIPTLLLLVGVAGGLGLGLVSRLVNRLVARSRARAADRRLRQAISAVAKELILEPIAAEHEAYRATRDSLQVVLRGR